MHKCTALSAILFNTNSSNNEYSNFEVIFKDVIFSHYREMPINNKILWVKLKELSTAPSRRDINKILRLRKRLQNEVCGYARLIWLTLSWTAGWFSGRFNGYRKDWEQAVHFKYSSCCESYLRDFFVVSCSLLSLDVLVNSCSWATFSSDTLDALLMLAGSLGVWFSAIMKGRHI